MSFSIVKPTEEGETTDEFTAQFTNCHGGQYNNLPNKQRYHIMYWMSNGKQLDMNSITRMEYEYYSFKYDHHRCGQVVLVLVVFAIVLIGMMKNLEELLY